MSDDRPRSFIDHARTASLHDVGQPDYWAAVSVTESGEDLLWLVCRDELDAEDPRCGSPDQPHEQLGPLPLEYVRRLTVSRRTHRCGRPTKATGRPCRIEVGQPGQPCAWHRTEKRAHA